MKTEFGTEWNKYTKMYDIASHNGKEIVVSFPLSLKAMTLNRKEAEQLKNAIEEFLKEKEWCCEDYRLAVEDYKTIDIKGKNNTRMAGAAIDYCPFCGKKLYP